MKKVKVLVIDDTVMYRKVLTDVLGELPDVELVGTASNGKSGLEKILQLQPDVVTLDFEMPVMDGIQTLKELKKTGADVAVVMVSAHTSQGNGQQNRKRMYQRFKLRCQHHIN